MRDRLRLCVLVGVTCLFVGGAAARGSGTGGALTQLASPDDCVSSGTTLGCGTTGAVGLRSGDWIATSPDGANVYVASFFGNSVAAFSRDASAGALTDLGCVSSSGCGTTAAGLRDATSVAVSPDGKNVYATASGIGAVVEFTRNGDGSLTPLGCIQDSSNTGTECATSAHGLVNAYDVAVAPDGNDVYVASGGSGNLLGAIAEFHRNSDGTLTQLASPNDCIEEQGDPTPVCGTTDGIGLLAVTALAVTSDGADVYAVNDTHAVRDGDVPGAITGFSRDAATGALTQRSCIGEPASVAVPECGTTTASGLTDLVNLAISPDGKDVYTASDDADGAIAAFAIGADGALSALGCIGGDGARCGATATGLASSFGVAVSPDGANLYVAAAGNRTPVAPGVVALARAADGTLSGLPAPDDCIQQEGAAGGTCGNTSGHGLGDALGVAVSADGANVYVAASGGAVAEFARGGTGGSGGATGEAPSFGSPVTYSTGAQPWYVAVGDLNGDGKADLAVPNLHSADVSIFTGNGDGTFTPKPSPDVGANPGAAALADLNSDGRLDLAVGDGGSSFVSTVLGNGDGTFGTRQDFAAGAADLLNQGIAVADLNGDGNRDIVVANGGNGTVSVLLGNGSGGTLSKLSYAAGSHPELLTLADLNGDGKLDLAVAASGDNAVSVLPGNGDGSFGAMTQLGVGANPGDVAVGDLNADGKPDLVATNYDEGTVSVLLGDGPGTFGTQVKYATGADAGSNPESVAIGDVNGDGHADVVVSNGTSNTISFFPGDGTGALGAKTDVAVGAAPISVALADLNGDGKLDVVTANSTDDDISVLLNGETAPPPPGNAAPTASFTSTASDLDVNVDASASSDSDGTIDSYAWDFGDGSSDSGATASHTYAVAGTYTVTLTVTDDGGATGTTSHDVAVTAPAESTPPTAVSFVPAVKVGTGVGSKPSAVAAGDLNGDGKIDLAAVAAGGFVSILLGDGSGGFGVPTNLSFSSARITSVSIADMNEDGDPDLVVAVQGSSFLSSTIVVVPGDGHGGFGTHAGFAAGVQPFSFAVADLNGDGHLDIAVAGFGGGRAGVAVLLGDGRGSLGSAAYFAAGTQPASVAVGDVDGDGKPDVALADRSANGVAVLLGDGAGGLGAPVATPTGQTASAVAAGDVNGDGRADLAVANFSSGTVSLLVADDHGGFVEPVDLATGVWPVAVAFADLNGDHRLDLVVDNQASPFVSVYLGYGDGRFEQGATFPTSAGSTMLAVADLNGDSRRDLVLSNDSDGLSLLFNSTLTPGVDEPPTASFAATTNGLQVSVDGSGSRDPDGSIESYRWSFGDGASGTGETANHVYAAAGSYTVELTVTDDGGATSTASHVVRSGAAPAAASFLPALKVGTGLGSRPFAVAAGDLNGDEKVDLAAVVSAGVAILLRDGDGLDVPVNVSFNSRRITSLEIADMNEDGRPDLVLGMPGTSFLGASVAVVPGDGRGGFGAPVFFSAGVQPFALAVADVNRDGHLDVVTTGYGDGRTGVGVLLGDGRGGLGSAAYFAVGAQPASVAVGDVNGDGKPDLALADQAANGVSVMLGDGAGAFGTPTAIQTGLQSSAVAVGDVNGDGRADLAVANFGSATVSVLVAGHDGGFGPPVDLATGVWPAAVAIADLNGDHRPDLVVVNQGSAFASVFLGYGNGTFEPATSFTATGGSTTLAVADLDGDGRQDLALADNIDSLSLLLTSTQLTTGLTPSTAPSGGGGSAPGGSSSGGSSSGGGASSTGAVSSGPTQFAAQVVGSRGGSLVVGSGRLAPTVTWRAGSFATPAVLKVVAADSVLPLGKSTSGAIALELTVVGADGTRVTRFTAPIELTFPAAPNRAVPSYSIDGKLWTRMPRLEGDSLPPGFKDGWFRDAKGDVHVLTLHATYFAILEAAAGAKSELATKVLAPHAAVLARGRRLRVRLSSTLPGTAVVVLRASGIVLGKARVSLSAGRLHPASLKLTKRVPGKARIARLTVVVRAGAESHASISTIRLRR